MNIFEAQKVLDGRNLSLFIPKSFRQKAKTTTEVNFLKQQKAREATKRQRVSRKNQRIFS